MPNWKKIIVSGSDALLSSAYIDGNLTASAIHSSGSTKFGSTSDNTHEFTGSIYLSGSLAELIYLDDANGRVGIKTDTPQYPFHYVQDTGNALAVYEKTGGAAIFYEAQDTRGALGTVASHPLLFAINSYEVSRINTDGVYEGDVSGSITGSFTGSFVGDGSNLTGIVATSTDSASVAARATTLSPDATASYADSATTASHALTAITASHTAGTASIANNAVTASFATLAGTIRSGLTASFADRATSASIADALSQLATASFAITASHALNGGSGGTSIGYSNLQTLSVDYTTESDSYNSLYGPLTIADGVTVTVTAGSFLKIEDF